MVEIKLWLYRRICFVFKSSKGRYNHNKRTNDNNSNNEWISVVAVCDFTTHKVNVVAKSLDSSKTYFDGEVDMADTDATGMSGLYFKYGKKAYGSISFDNIEIFSADQYTE